MWKGGGSEGERVPDRGPAGSWRMTGSANRLNESRDGRCDPHQKKHDSSPKKKYMLKGEVRRGKRAGFRPDRHLSDLFGPSFYPAKHG